MKEKIKSILTKIKDNKKKVVGITVGVLVVFIFTFVVYNMNNPTKLNKLFASIGSTPNEAFEDSDFYNCIIDEYNNENSASKAYTDSLTDEELAIITNLTCTWRNIESTKGIEKLTGLTSLDLQRTNLTSIDLSNNTSLTNLNLSNNQLTNIDLSNNVSLKSLTLSDNLIKNIDLTNNLSLEELNISYDKVNSQLTNIDLSNNTNLKRLDLSDARLENIDLSNNVELTDLDLSSNQLTNINLSNNTKLNYLYLTNNKLTSLDLSNITNLSSLYINGTPLIEDILMQNGETYTIEEKIIPPSGQSFSYSIDDTSVASISGNTIKALQEGSTTLRTRFGNVSFERILVVGEVKLNPRDINVQINNEENYIYFKEINSFLINDSETLKEFLNPNIGEIVKDNNILKVVIGDKAYLEYKMVYFDGGALGTDDSGDYSVVVSSVENPTKYNIEAVNCTYEFANDGKEVIIKYNNNEIDRKKVVYMYLPNDYKFSFSLLYFGNNIFDSSIINNIDDVSQIDKNKVNILNAQMIYKNDDGNYFDIRDGEKKVSEYYPVYINSNTYDLTNKYIYVENEFNNDIQLLDSEHERIYDFNLDIVDNNIQISAEGISIYNWDLIKVTSDKYDMSSDKIDLKGEDIDLSKIDVTNALLKVDNDKLLVMYNDEVVKEFKLENGKMKDTTKPSSEEKTTTTTKVTTKENKKTTNKTTTKKKSIINKIFGKSETTTVTTTKKSIDISKKNTSKDTTKVINNTNKVISNNINKKVVYQDNILLILSICLMIALSTCLIVVYRKNKEK